MINRFTILTDTVLTRLIAWEKNQKIYIDDELLQFSKYVEQCFNNIYAVTKTVTCEVQE